MDKKMIKEMYHPFWKSSIMYNETVVMIKKGDNAPSGRLIFSASEIISVKNYTLQYEYSPEEYSYQSGILSLTKNSTIPFLTEDQMNGENLPDGFGLTYQKGLDDNSKVTFTTGTGIIKHQIAVTYKHNDKWNTPITKYLGDKLPNTMKKLIEKRPMKWILYGDSIMAGCGSSHNLLIEPHLPDIGPGFVSQIEDKYQSKIELINMSQGGTMSNWGKGESIVRVNGYNPDLVIIAFGMNDGSAGVRPIDYKANIEGIIKSAKEKNPNIEFILVSTILANPITKQNHRQKEYLAMNIELTKEYKGIINIDMSSFTEELYKRKRGIDFLANHINHPSDFLVRCYVMNLVSALVK
ncbi:MAG: SGNH/GDSL hydrolase family protein [Candidatus Izimaplasma sp.]|nr:SGNH/GDSL hydrolase family protein [Candidatus Izimaplasma bacterium]